MSHTVLLVDDDASVTAALIRRLHVFHREWIIHEVHSFQGAVDLVHRERVDVIVTDLAMPGNSGFDLLRELKADPMTEQIPVIVVTGYGDEDTKRKSLQFGAADLLSKPVNIIDLKVRIENTLKIKDYIDEIHKHREQLKQIVEERTKELEASRTLIAIRLAKFAEIRDETTGNHTVRVGCYAEEVARELGMPTEFCRTIFLASMMHDIGKVAVPDHILRKPGKLTKEEWDIMRKHTRQGAMVLHDQPRLLLQILQERRFPGLDENYEDPVLVMAERIAEFHHELWDGSGYPYGLQGDQIPIEARIVTIADQYDALTTNRPYRETLSDEEALQIMTCDHAGHFDPQVFEAFIRSLPKLQEIRDMINRLDTHEIEEAA